MCWECSQNEAKNHFPTFGPLNALSTQVSSLLLSFFSFKKEEKIYFYGVCFLLKKTFLKRHLGRYKNIEFHFFVGFDSTTVSKCTVVCSSCWCVKKQFSK